MTALRSLNIALGLTDGVTDKLRGLDSQISGIESSIGGAQMGFGALEKATQEYGYTARQEIDGVGRDISALDRQVDQHADITEKATDKSAKSWAKLGAVIGGAALATEAFVRAQQDHYVTAEGVGYITGMTQREVVGLAGSLIDLSTTQADAFGLLHAGARQGLRDAEDLSAYTEFWSNIGTVAREDSVALAEAGVSLRAVGIEAQDLTDHYDTFGFVMSKTTGSVSEFLRLTGYMARDMDSYGMEISDVAVLLAALEEKGMGAADSKRALRTAMSSAKGDTRGLYRELGVTESQLSRLNDEVVGGADYITRMGEAFDDSRSPLQHVQTLVSGIATSIGFELNPLLGDASLVLSTTSSALLAAASASFLYSTISSAALLPSLAAATASVGAFSAALLANPLTWVAVAVVGLGVALYALYTRWDDISGWFMDKWEAVSGVVTGAMDGIRGAWDSTVGALISGAEWLVDRMDYLMLLTPFTAPIGAMHLLRDNWDDVVAGIGSGWDSLVDAAHRGAAWMGEVIGGGLEKVTGLFYDYHPLGILISQWDDITGYLRGIDLFEIGRDILLGFVGGILDVRDHLFDTVAGIGEGILGSITGFFGISSPSKLMEEMGGYVGEGFTRGIEGSMPDSLEWSLAPQVAAVTPYSVAMTDPGGVVAYRGVLSEPSISALAGEIAYSPSLGDVSVPPLAGQAVYISSLTEPTVGDLAGVARYRGVVDEPGIGGLAGEVTYQGILCEPTVSDLEGRATYQSSLDVPAIDDLTGRAVYHGIVDVPAVSALAGEITYHPAIDDVLVPVLAGEITYQSSLTGPAVSGLAGEATYHGVVDEPTLNDLAGVARYSSVIEDAGIRDLTGRVAYTSQVTEPMIDGLTGEVRYASHLLEPTTPGLEGQVTYQGTLDVPSIDTLAGEVKYVSQVSKPTIEDLAGRAMYEGVLDVPAVSTLAGEVVYTSTLLEPDIPDLYGVVGYQGALMSIPDIPTLAGTVEYHGILAGVPDVSDIGSRYDVMVSQIDDTGPSWTPESDAMAQLKRYTPERDAQQSGGDIFGDVNFTANVTVNSQGGDAREIAATVDRRLRQTFDRHANTYFGRQRRRSGG